MTTGLVLGAILILEAALLVLAVVHARSGRLRTLARWIALTIILGTLPVSVIGIGDAVWEISTLPFTRPGNALGTYWEPTGLMIVGVLVTGSLFIVAGILALVRRRWAVVVYIVIAVAGFVDAARVSLVGARPVDSTITGVIVSVIPALVLAALLLALSDDQPLWPRRNPHREGD